MAIASRVATRAAARRCRVAAEVSRRRASAGIGAPAARGVNHVLTLFEVRR